MKKSFSLFLAICMLLTMALCPVVYAADDAAPASYSNGSTPDPNVYDSGGGVDIAIQGGRSIELFGSVQPTIISVTMPSYIPFDLSPSVTYANKAVSPAIDITNHSNVPVDIVIEKTAVNMNLAGAQWSDDGQNISSAQVAVGLRQNSTMPTDFGYNTVWLKKGNHNQRLLDNVPSNAERRMYIVGNIGSSVTATGNFTVTPTLLVKKTGQP